MVSLLPKTSLACAAPELTGEARTERSASLCVPAPDFPWQPLSPWNPGLYGKLLTEPAGFSQQASDNVEL